MLFPLPGQNLLHLLAPTWKSLPRGNHPCLTVLLLLHIFPYTVSPWQHLPQSITLYLFVWLCEHVRLAPWTLSSWRVGTVMISSPLRPRTQRSSSRKYLAQSSSTLTHWWMDERMTSVLCLCLESVLVGRGAANRARSAYSRLYSRCSIRSWLEAKFRCALYSSPRRESFPFGGEEWTPPSGWILCLIWS